MSNFAHTAGRKIAFNQSCLTRNWRPEGAGASPNKFADGRQRPPSRAIPIGRLQYTIDGRTVSVPREIIKIVPTWRGFDYFMVGDQIVIVDRRTMEIVAVLDA